MPIVTLLSHTPQPEQVVAAAARLCYSNAGVQSLLEELTPEKTQSLVQMLAEIGHQSPLEHAVFTFGIEGVSRALLAQLTRHRIASYSVQSQRYVNKTGFHHIMPPAIAALPQAAQRFQQAMQQAGEHYEALVELLRQEHTARLCSQGVEPAQARRQAEKMAIEDARFVLPNACDTKIVLTMNARSLRGFFQQRCCRRAQWEIRELAEEMLRAVLQVAPTLFSQAGPGCLAGGCPEGKMSCGAADEVRRHYTQLTKGVQACPASLL